MRSHGGLTEQVHVPPHLEVYTHVIGCSCSRGRFHNRFSSRITGANGTIFVCLPTVRSKIGLQLLALSHTHTRAQGYDIGAVSVLFQVFDHHELPVHGSGLASLMLKASTVGALHCLQSALAYFDRELHLQTMMPLLTEIHPLFTTAKWLL